MPSLHQLKYKKRPSKLIIQECFPLNKNKIHHQVGRVLYLEFFPRHLIINSKHVNKIISKTTSQ